MLPTPTDILSHVRHHLKEKSMDAFFCMYDDMLSPKTLPGYHKRLRLLTGFTGSAGMAFVTQEKAILWVDGRYPIQAEKETSTAWEIWTPSTHKLEALQKLLTHKQARIAVDGMTLSWHLYEKLAPLFTNFSGLEMVSWHPVDMALESFSLEMSRPSTYVYALPLSLQDHTPMDVLQDLYKMLRQKNIDAYLCTDPDIVSWLWHTRRSEEGAPCPDVQSYAFMTSAGEAYLFSPTSLTQEEKALFHPARCHPMSSLETFLDPFLSQKKVIATDPDTTPAGLVKKLKAGKATLRLEPGFLETEKAMKSPKILQCFENAHLQDGLALSHFFQELDDGIQEEITEYQAAQKLAAIRQKRLGYQGPSFDTIFGAGPSGAMIHYKPHEESSRVLQKGDICLVDSGGHYMDSSGLLGTTDVTRTRVFQKKEAPEKVKMAYTRVLKGLITLSRTLFPEGTTGHQLDALARYDLWQWGIDYAHGTGHGVGTFLNVHEGPQNISSAFHKVALKKGMVVSLEPGYYRDHDFGIRLENLASIVDASASDLFLDKEGHQKARFLKKKTPFLGFKTLTLSPFEAHLLKPSLLSKTDTMWLASYHEKVWAHLSPHLESPQKKWLSEACAPFLKSSF